MVLQRAALGYGRRGWPVVAGACLLGDRFTCGLGCRTVSCHPAHEDWEINATADLATIATTWRRKPFSVLLSTGEAFDALDVPAYIGVLNGDRVRGPVALTPTGRWMFLVRPGGCLEPELASHHGVVLHGAGSWIPAPPMRTPAGRVRWAIAPHQTDWRLPDADDLQETLVAELPWLASRPSRTRRAA
jgi:hypothetical protein